MPLIPVLGWQRQTEPKASMIYTEETLPQKVAPLKHRLPSSKQALLGIPSEHWVYSKKLPSQQDLLYLSVTSRMTPKTKLEDLLSAWLGAIDLHCCWVCLPLPVRHLLARKGPRHAGS